MEMIDSRIYDDIFLLAKIFNCTELNKDERERIYKHFEKRKKGKWMYKIGMVECDQCLRAIRRIDHDGILNFCPNCGADMRKEE